MNDLRVFENADFGKIRTVMIDGNIWFVGKDVATALGYSDTADALKKHIDDEDKKHIKPGEMPTLKMSNYGAYIINESGLYSLIFASKLDSARAFKHWVTAEVLPSIRKSGAYTASEKSGDAGKPAVSLGALVRLIEVERTTMLEMHCEPHAIGKMIVELSRAYNVYVPEVLSNAMPDQISFYDNVALLVAGKQA